MPKMSERQNQFPTLQKCGWSVSLGNSINTRYRLLALTRMSDNYISWNAIAWFLLRSGSNLVQGGSPSCPIGGFFFQMMDHQTHFIFCVILETVPPYFPGRASSVVSIPNLLLFPVLRIKQYQELTDRLIGCVGEADPSYPDFNGSYRFIFPRSSVQDQNGRWIPYY